MKSSMMIVKTAAAFVQRQKIINNDPSRRSLCHAATVLFRTVDNTNNTTPQSVASFIETKVISTSSSSELFYPTYRHMRCYTTLSDTATTIHYRHNTSTTSCSSNCSGIQLQPPPLAVVGASSTITSFLQQHQQQQIRWMGTKKNKESKHQKNKAKQKSQIKKQQLQIQQQKLARQLQQKQQSDGVSSGDEHSSVAAATSVTTPKGGGAAEQHKEWVEFQKSIEVDGFETGQTLTAIDASKKGRSGGKAATKKRLTKRDEMADKIKERQRLMGRGGGEFPPMRYSDEETERLLKQAYAAIPARTGRRGTLQLKRQKKRWHLVREIHRKYKQHIMKFHVRRMERRSAKMKQIKDFVSNVAPIAVQEDIEYQSIVRQRFISMIDRKSVV